MTNKGVEDASVHWQVLDYETPEIEQNSRALDERPKVIRRVSADRVGIYCVYDFHVNFYLLFSPDSTTMSHRVILQWIMTFFNLDQDLGCKHKMTN